MSTINARFMLTVPNDMAERAELLKKDTYYNKSYAEMYRQLIQLGMGTLEVQKAVKNCNSEKTA